jgi:putative membrane protein
MSYPAGFVDETPRNEGAGNRPEMTQLESADRNVPLGPQMLDHLEQPAIHRIDPQWDPSTLMIAKSQTSALRWFGAGVGALLGCSLLFSVVGIIEAQFQYSRATGFLAASSFMSALLLVLRGCWGEWRSYRCLKRADQLRLALYSENIPGTELTKLCRVWLSAARLRVGDADATLAALMDCTSPAAARVVLQREVIRHMHAQAQQAGRRAALRGCAVIALFPSPVMEGAIVAWQSLGLIGQIADIYGLRPSMIVTFTLFGRVALSAASVAGIDLISQTFADQVLQRMPGIRHLAAAVPGMSLAAVRIARLAELTADACSPLAKRPAISTSILSSD